MWNLVKTIFFLLIVIAFLLALIMLFGLGGGGGSWLPGSGGGSGVSQNQPMIDTPTKTPTTEAKPTTVPEPSKTVTPDEPTASTVSGEKQKLRRELTISFVPTQADPDSAEPLVCNVSWTDIASKSKETRPIKEANMADFEFALEKAIRSWFTSFQSDTVIDEPIVAVSMTPFPGQGTFDKIKAIVNRIDSRISTMQLGEK